MTPKNGPDYDPELYFRFNYAGNSMIVSADPLPVRLQTAVSLFLEPIQVEAVADPYREPIKRLIGALDRTLTLEEAAELAVLFVRLKENLAGDYHESLGG